MFVINDPKYVHIQEDAEAELTDYALEHIDECCLIFNRETRVSKHYDDSYYRICFLCRDADSKSFVEATSIPAKGKMRMCSKEHKKCLPLWQKPNE